jgi:hypothetical protein
MSGHDMDAKAVAQALYPEAQPEKEITPDEAAKVPQSRAVKPQDRTAKPQSRSAKPGQPDTAGPNPQPVSGREIKSAADTAAKALEKTRSQAIKDLQQRWGGDYERNLELANKAVNRFGGHALVEELALNGKGLSPALVRAFCKVGKAISEDSFISGDSGAVTKKDIAKILYGKTS